MATNTLRKQQAKTLLNIDSDSNSSKEGKGHQIPQQAEDATTYASQQTLNASTSSVNHHAAETERRQSQPSMDGRSRKGSNPYIDEDAHTELIEEVKESIRSGDLKVDGGEANPEKIPISLL